MKTRPRPGRLIRLAPPFLAPLLGVTLTLCALLNSGVAVADASWPYDWRPNWIPGDPLTEGPGSLAARWVVFDQVAPGLIVALDPVTRLPVRPSAAQRAAAAAIFEASHLLGPPDGVLPTERIPGGGELIHLQGRYQMFSVARRGADGRFTTDCSSDPVAASRPLAQPAQNTRRGEEK